MDTDHEKFGQEESEIYSKLLIKFLLILTEYSIVILVFCLGFTDVGLIWRYFSVRFGSRVKPDAKKAILITGATSGIGLTIAKHFYKLGFTVVAAYYSDQEPGYNELLELGRLPYASVCKKRQKNSEEPKMFLVKMDVCSRESIAGSAREINKLFDAHSIELYCLINNAGLAAVGAFEWCDLDSFTNLVDVNVKGVMKVTREFIMDIISNKGRVVNVSSGFFLLPIKRLTAYGSCKSAVAYFSASLNEDIKGYGASSVCVFPGNFMKNSNIIYPQLRIQQETEKKLTERERSLYRTSIEKNKILMNRMLKRALETTEANRDQVASFYSIDIPDLSEVDEKVSYLRRLRNWIVRQLDGSTAEFKTLEESGNFSYTNIMGPSMEYLPRVLYGGLAWLQSKVLG